MISMHEMLSVMYEKGASDLHITTGIAPTIRVDGRLVPLPSEPLTPPDTKRLCYSILTEAQKQRFEEEKIGRAHV
jgi:twitching motility protein PilT